MISPIVSSDSNSLYTTISNTLIETEEALNPNGKASASLSSLMLKMLLDKSPETPLGISKKIEKWLESLSFPCGYLLPSFISGSNKKLYPVGIACDNSNYLTCKKLFKMKGIHVFNTQGQGLYKQINTITSCQRVIAVSFNALQISHAYQIPTAYLPDYSLIQNTKLLEYCNQIGLSEIPTIEAKEPLKQQDLLDKVDSTPQPNFKPDIKNAFHTLPITRYQRFLLKEKNQPLVILNPSPNLKAFFQKEILAYLPQSNHLQYSLSKKQWQAIKGDHHNFLFVDIFNKSLRQLQKKLRSLQEKLGPCRVILATEKQSKLLSNDKINSTEELDYDKVYSLVKNMFPKPPYVFVMEEFLDFPMLELEKIFRFLKEPKTLKN